MSQSQPQSTRSPQKKVVSSTEEIADFGEDTVVILGNYFWSKKQKAILKKVLKRTREGIIKHVPALDKIVWKTDAPNEKQGVVNTVATIGVFAGANYNSVL